MTDISITSTESTVAKGEQRGFGRHVDTSSMREELSNLKSDLDALMSHASTLTESELREARDRIMKRFSSMRVTAKGIADQAGKQLNDGMDVAVDYVRERPLQAVAVASVLGVLIGVLMRRS